MNYRDLLKKYMRLIGEAEGILFLSNTHKTPEISDSEWDELLKLAKEVNKDEL